MYNRLFSELEIIERDVRNFILNHHKDQYIVKPDILNETLVSYLQGGGKRLRPAILLFCSDLLGGDRKIALPTAASVELFHTWTLVHDDIIDNDITRRGVKTVHIQIKDFAHNHYKFDEKKSGKYGIDGAILTGDIQHGWSIYILANSYLNTNIDLRIPLKLISELQSKVLKTLVEGELMDVDFSLNRNISELQSSEILDMLWKKTGVLYEYCGMAGGLLGKNTAVIDEEIQSLIDFTGKCGTAFQVYDDILGLFGNAQEIGKPVGSDIREGKKTILIVEAYKNATPQEKQFIDKNLGKSSITNEEIQKIKEIVTENGGLDKARNICKDLVNQSFAALSGFKDSDSKDLLMQWGNYLIDRNV